jgi:clostripain
MNTRIQLPLHLALAILTHGLCAAPEAARQPGAHPKVRPAWTVLIYAAVDNDWEKPFMKDIRSMKKGLRTVDDLEVVLLIDRSPRYSKDDRSLGEDFAGTRLYRLTGGTPERLEGGRGFPGIAGDKELELNTGDARTLRTFIRYGKANYPARHTALFLVSHGDGMVSCPDETNGDDQLFTAEFSDVLGQEESVDLLGFDACLMAGVENAYQWRAGDKRFGADYLIASAPLSSSWPYADIFSRLGPGQGSTAPGGLSPAGFSRLVIDELHRQIAEGRSGDKGLERDLQAWGAFELKHAPAVKAALDKLAVALWEEKKKEDLLTLRGSGLKAGTFVYVWPEKGAEASMPNVDICHLAERISESPRFSPRIRALAATLAGAADQMVLHSVGFKHYRGFEQGRHGLYVIFPDGDKTDRRGKTYWQKIHWFDALRHEDDDDAYGFYAWCYEGSIPGNQRVETWFELMDAWFDRGRSNGYNW